MPVEASLRRRVQEIGAEEGAEAIGVAFHDTHHETGGDYDADRWFHAASTIKVPVLLGVFDAIREERLEARSRVHVRNRFLSVADGTPYRIQPSRDADAANTDPEPEPTTAAVSVPDGEFVCEECDFRTTVESSSLRAGDFCPECQTGTLVHYEA